MNVLILDHKRLKAIGEDVDRNLIKVLDHFLVIGDDEFYAVKDRYAASAGQHYPIKSLAAYREVRNI